jgi:hypothetical protein
MSDNTLTTTEEEENDNSKIEFGKEPAPDPTETPVVSGPSNGEVKDIDAVDDDHPLVEETGDAALKTQTESGAGEFLSDFIYEHDSAWVREWLQNEETACVRAAKLLIRISDDYPDGWLRLSMWVDNETGESVVDYDENQSILAEYDGEAVNLREIEVPRPIDEVLEASRSLGYDPTIVWDVYRDEREIETVDNGIGMTPFEFDEAFNTIFNSGSGVDGETGGMFGVGSESSALVHGNDGGCEVETRSRRPTQDGEGHDGFRAYSYLGGANALPGEIDDGFKGTRFNIPVQDSFDLDELQEWVEKYSEKLRVPLLYREHDAGSTPVEEEYEATKFLEDYEDPPIQLEFPGEFSVVAGPDVVPYTRYSEPDPETTYLVSMPIDRNTRASISTLWDVVIQIHDEQGRIVFGPNRGYYSDGSKVYPNSDKVEVIGELQEDDVMLPEPTGDRDRLQKDSESKNFFYHVQDVVKSEEMKQISDIAERMKEADHPADAILGEKGDWTLFKKMVDYHGSRRTTDRKSKFEDFVDSRDELPDFDDETLTRIYNLFTEVEHCNNGASRSKKKSGRNETVLGNILSKTDPESVYMAASTGGNFKNRFRVLQNTDSKNEVIVVNGASKYDKWGEHFGFKVLKNVPLKKSTDEEPHDYDVPDSIHAEQMKKGRKSTGKPDELLNRSLKIRTDDDNSSIDLRLSIENAQEALEDGRSFGGHSKLVLFPNGQDHENISDHYDMAKYAAIASVAKKEYEELADYDNVLTYEEYRDWSTTALIATEDGAMTPKELIEDDRMVVLTYRKANPDPVKLLSDENEPLRQLYCEDVRDQLNWLKYLDDYEYGYSSDDKESDIDDSEKDDTLFAVAGPIVLSRAEFAFDQIRSENRHERDIRGLKLSRDKYGHRNPTVWNTLNKPATRYKLMVETPNWDNDSNIYDMMPSRRDRNKAQMYLGFHDLGIDPSEKSSDELRELISQNGN